MICKNRTTKIGLITVMSPNKNFPEEYVKQVRESHLKARETLSGLNYIVHAPEKISRTMIDLKKQSEELRRKNVHLLVIYVGRWTDANISVLAAINIGVPVIVWAGSIVGASIVRGSLDEIGIKNYLIFGDFKEERLRKKLKILIDGISGATKLRGMVYGEGGTRSMGMVTARIDPSEWLSKFGIDVDGFEQVEIIYRAKRYPEKKVMDFLSWMEKQFGGIEVKKEVIDAQIRLYFALREIIEERGYDFISVKCLPEMPYFYTTFCLAHALLNDSTDDGFGCNCSFVTACESDANGALTMQILNNISGKTTLFTDVLRYDYENNIVTFCNCGSHPTDFASSRKDVVWVPEGLLEHKWKIGGTCPRHVGKPGEVTIARLSRINRKYIMSILGGNAMEMPQEKLKEANPQHPQLFVKLNCGQDSFIDSLRSNHMHLVYGDYKEELKIICEILDIEVLNINHAY